MKMWINDAKNYIKLSRVSTSLLIVEEVLFKTSVLATVNDCAVVLFASVRLPLAMTPILLFLHQVLIKHFLISDLVVIHLIV